MRSIGLATVMFIGCAGAAQAQAPEQFTTSRGSTLLLPQIAGMECDEMTMMLRRIDATRYRENAPRPLDPADAPLYEYELMLARAHFERCIQTRTGEQRGLRMLRQTAD